MRILALKPIPVPPPPPTPMFPPPQPLPPAPTTIEVFNGTTRQAPAIFPSNVPPQPAPPPTPIIVVQQPPTPKQAEYVFTKPAAPTADKGK